MQQFRQFGVGLLIFRPPQQARRRLPVLPFRDLPAKSARIHGTGFFWSAVGGVWILQLVRLCLVSISAVQTVGADSKGSETPAAGGGTYVPGRKVGIIELRICDVRGRPRKKG